MSCSRTTLYFTGSGSFYQAAELSVTQNYSIIHLSEQLTMFLMKGTFFSQDIWTSLCITSERFSLWLLAEKKNPVPSLVWAYDWVFEVHWSRDPVRHDRPNVNAQKCFHYTLATYLCMDTFSKCRCFHCRFLIARLKFFAILGVAGVPAGRQT